ncbi:MAG TPA: ATP-binding cassette domain-containing protein, partial [Micromonosporaceae bacterium]|nr:ATP-binding cassette domain-containing protein [Micromonosporaceae bacterium]
MTIAAEAVACQQPRGPQPVLEVTDLSVRFPGEPGPVQAVRNISYQVMPGQVLGIVGESGSGKSVSS